MKSTIFSIISIATLVLPGAASAHHSHAMFDERPGHEATLVDATVKDFQWTNPHIWWTLLVKDPKTGEQVEWDVLGGPPQMVHRAGWTHRTFRVGDKGTFIIHPLKNGSHGGSFEKAIVNGKTIVEIDAAALRLINPNFPPGPPPGAPY